MPIRKTNRFFTSFFHHKQMGNGIPAADNGTVFTVTGTHPAAFGEAVIPQIFCRKQLLQCRAVSGIIHKIVLMAVCSFLRKQNRMCWDRKSIEIPLRADKGIVAHRQLSAASNMMD
jgi:hypothetical protein